MPPTEAVYRSAPYQSEIEATVVDHREGGVVLDRTVFYPAGGGQPGDAGSIAVLGDDTKVTVAEAVHASEAGTVVHRLAEGDDPPPVGAAVRAAIDWDRRHRHMRVHTTLHLLCSIVDGWVTGGQIGAERGRLDFDLEEAPDKAALTDQLNALIMADHPIVEEWIEQDDLDANPSLVRTLSVKPPRTGDGRIRLVRIGPQDAPIDRQPCGGTHVRSTAEIGSVAVTKIEKKGRRNRRIVVTLASD